MRGVAEHRAEIELSVRIVQLARQRQAFPLQRNQRWAKFDRNKLFETLTVSNELPLSVPV